VRVPKETARRLLVRLNHALPRLVRPVLDLRGLDSRLRLDPAVWLITKALTEAPQPVPHSSARCPVRTGLPEEERASIIADWQTELIDFEEKFERRRIWRSI
jgi:hypothetical protein